MTNNGKVRNRLDARERRLLENWLEEHVDRFRKEGYTQEKIGVEASAYFDRHIACPNVKTAMRACDIQWGRVRSNGAAAVSERLSRVERNLTKIASALAIELDQRLHP